MMSRSSWNTPPSPLPGVVYATSRACVILRRSIASSCGSRIQININVAGPTVRMLYVGKPHGAHQDCRGVVAVRVRGGAQGKKQKTRGTGKRVLHISAMLQCLQSIHLQSEPAIGYKKVGVAVGALPAVSAPWRSSPAAGTAGQRCRRWAHCLGKTKRCGSGHRASERRHLPSACDNHGH